MIRLARREKLLVGALGIFIAAWSVFTVGVKPALARIETLNRVISEKQQELEKLHTKSEKYICLRDNIENLCTKVASQQSTFELLPFLESLIEESGLTQKVSAMKQQVLPIDSNYHETIVEVRLENLSLDCLVDFLLKIESPQFLARNKSLYIKKNETDKGLLDAVVEIRNVKLTQNPDQP